MEDAQDGRIAVDFADLDPAQDLAAGLGLAERVFDGRTGAGKAIIR